MRITTHTDSVSSHRAKVSRLNILAVKAPKGCSPKLVGQRYLEGEALYELAEALREGAISPAALRSWCRRHRNRYRKMVDEQ